MLQAINGSAVAGTKKPSTTRANWYRRAKRPDHFSDATDPHNSFCALEAQIEAADVSMDSYGVIVSPGTRQILRTTPSFTGGSLTTWSEIRGGQSSPEVTDGRALADVGQI